jgi:hypothetical protein
MEFANKREHTLWLIEQGGATNESIEAATEMTNKSRGTIFAQLRLMGKYPMADENGVYHIGTAEEFEAKKAASAANRKPAVALTPAQALEKAKARETKASKALTTASARLNMNPDSRELQLRHRIAELELELASVLLSEVEGQPNQDLDVEVTADTADDELV